MKNRKYRLEPWKLGYFKRKQTSKKYKDTEKQIKALRLLKDWVGVMKLQRLIRLCWWGIKRYK
jgi:L-fucose isomerase-like protein